MKKMGLLGMIAVVSFCLPAIGREIKGKDEPADSFFGVDAFHTIHLHMSEEDWQLMQPSRRTRPAPLIADSIPAPSPTAGRKPAPAAAASVLHQKKPLTVDGEKLPPNNFGWEFVYVKSAFECDGQRLGSVAVRFKGNASYDNYEGSLKRPLKIDFNRFVPGQKFSGLETINLSNNAFDASQLREALSYEVYRLAGVPAPRTAFANVYLTVDGRYDRQFVGLYTIIEEPDDKSYLKEHFGNTNGLMLKPEGIRGLPYMGENWEAYGQHYHPKTTEHNPEMAQRFIDFVKLVNYADDATFNAKIGDYLNVDDFLRYTAATVLIANLDSPLVTNHNYYLYQNPADKKVWLLPWDMNLSFAGYGTPGPRDEQINLNIEHPWAGQNKLFKRVLEIKENDAAYRKHLRAFVDAFYNRATMRPLIEKMQKALDRANKASGGLGTGDDNNGSAFGFSRYTLVDFITRRITSVSAQLDGKDVGTFIPRPNPANMVFRWGINAPYEFGSLPNMAQAIRRHADLDGDYYVSGRELRDAAAELFYSMVDESHPESLSEDELAAGLSELLRDFAPQGNRGFFGLNRGAGSAGVLWARAAFELGDTDNDGRLTLAEVTDLVTRLACLSDRDNNDKLDEREIIEGLDRLAAPNPSPPNAAYRRTLRNRMPAPRNGGGVVR